MIVATAGHVDHGKTSLIKRLTGVDTDRLAEEKRRGLTIDLGFAYRQINDEVTLGFIDVPGHSRFINTMIAGVCGIDLGMLIVAADDGPMPQTLEHLDVMRLLGISEFVLIVSKIDRVNSERVEEVVRELQALLPDTAPPVFRLSNTSGQGISELQAWLNDRALAFKARSTHGNFRLAVDRAFQIKGVGLVVTGTAMSGIVAPGDELELLPQGTKVRVRSLRVQDCEASQGQVGDRCALNIVGAQDIHRGDSLATIDSLHCGRHLDTRVHLLQRAPYALKHLSWVKIYIGTRRLACRLYFINRIENKPLAPGGDALAQLILSGPVGSCAGDRFIIRDDSESITLGGGIVLDSSAPQSGKSRQHRLDYLAAMELPSPDKRLMGLLKPGSPVLDVNHLTRSWNIRADELERLFAASESVRFQAGGEEFALAKEDWAAAQERVVLLVNDFHKKNPQKPGVGLLELQRSFPSPDDDSGRKALFKAVVSALVRFGSLCLEGGQIKSAHYKPLLSVEEKAGWIKIEEVLEQRGMVIPLLTEVTLSSGLSLEQARAAVQAAARLNLVHKLNDNRYGLPKTLLKHMQLVAELGQGEEGITVISYKNRIGTGRKLAIEILEYFDTTGFTQRRGDRRIVISNVHLSVLSD